MNVFDQIRHARLQKGLTQIELANAVACSQGAISRFEHGEQAALSLEKLKTIGDFLGIRSDLLCMPKPAASHPAAGRRKYCTSPWCPSAVIARVQGRAVAYPAMVAGDQFCSICGELLKDACPACQQPVGAGAFCGACGAAFLALDEDIARDLIAQRQVCAGEGESISAQTAAMSAWCASLRG